MLVLETYVLYTDHVPHKHTIVGYSLLGQGCKEAYSPPCHEVINSAC